MGVVYAFRETGNIHKLALKRGRDPISFCIRNISMTYSIVLTSVDCACFYIPMTHDDTFTVKNGKDTLDEEDGWYMLFVKPHMGDIRLLPVNTALLNLRNWWVHGTVYLFSKRLKDEKHQVQDDVKELTDTEIRNLLCNWKIHQLCLEYVTTVKKTSSIRSFLHSTLPSFFLTGFENVKKHGPK